MTIAGTSGPFTVQVPFSIDTSERIFFKPTGSFTLPNGATSIALLAQPTLASRTVKTSITLQAGLNGEAACSSEIGLKLAADLAKFVKGDPEGKSGIALKAGGNVSGGQTTDFEVTYQRITGIPIKPRT